MKPEECITCGDVAVEARLVRAEGTTGIVEVDGASEEIALELVFPVAPGDTLLCHAGIALKVVARA